MSSEETWAKLRDLEHALHTLTIQRQAHDGQLAEADHALKALPVSGDAWRVIGNIMVKRDAAVLRAELTEKRAALKSRSDAATRQEKELREKLTQLQAAAVQGE